MTGPELPPEVKAAAFDAVKDALLGRGEVGPAKSSEFYRYVVDVVAEVLAAQSALSCPRHCEPPCAWTGVTEQELIQHYIDVHHSPTQDAYDGVCKAYWKRVARADVLTEALDTAIEALGWAGNYIAVPWPKAYQVEPLRAALAAAVEGRTALRDEC